MSYFFAFVGLSYSSDVNGFKFGACLLFLVTSGVLLFRGATDGLTGGGNISSSVEISSPSPLPSSVVPKSSSEEKSFLRVSVFPLLSFSNLTGDDVFFSRASLTHSAPRLNGLTVDGIKLQKHFTLVHLSPAGVASLVWASISKDFVVAEASGVAGKLDDERVRILRKGAFASLSSPRLNSSSCGFVNTLVTRLFLLRGTVNDSSGLLLEAFLLLSCFFREGK